MPRPSNPSHRGKTPALSRAEAKRLLNAPPSDTLKGLRDRAILATYLFHGLRASELAGICPKHVHSREGIPHLEIHGKGSKERFVPFHPFAKRLVEAYLELGGHSHEIEQPIFRSVSNPRSTSAPCPPDPSWIVQGCNPEMGSRRWNRNPRIKPRDEGDCGDECAPQCGRHRRSPGVARACEHLHDEALRPKEDETRRQPYVPSEILVRQPDLYRDASHKTRPYSIVL